MDFKLRILLELLILYILVYFSEFFYERLIFYELFCEGPSALRKYALTAVRGLSGTKKNPICTCDCSYEGWLILPSYVRLAIHSLLSGRTSVMKSTTTMINFE